MAAHGRFQFLPNATSTQFTARISRAAKRSVAVTIVWGNRKCRSECVANEGSATLILITGIPKLSPFTRVDRQRVFKNVHVIHQDYNDTVVVHNG